MKDCRITTAMGTPLTDADELHVESFDRHLDDVCDAGHDAVLVAGTMGNMQLLSEQTYRALIQRAAATVNGRCELLVGAGDTSFARTRDRILWINQHVCDGVAVLTPYFTAYSQQELIEYFLALADQSRWPIYLYDLPAKTGVALEIPTVLRLAEHPNIAGIKCSGDLARTWSLFKQIPPGFRMQIAQPTLLDTLIQSGFPEHVDGMYALAPRWTTAIRQAVLTNQTERARILQRKLIDLLGLLKTHGVMPTFTALMNARGFPGRFAPRPAAGLSSQAIAELLAHPVVVELLAASKPPQATDDRPDRTTRPRRFQPT